jgi:hypothetical protein
VRVRVSTNQNYHDPDFDSVHEFHQVAKESAYIKTKKKIVKFKDFEKKSPNINLFICVGCFYYYLCLYLSKITTNAPERNNKKQTITT